MEPQNSRTEQRLLRFLGVSEQDIKPGFKFGSKLALNVGRRHPCQPTTDDKHTSQDVRALEKRPSETIHPTLTPAKHFLPLESHVVENVRNCLLLSNTRIPDNTPATTRPLVASPKRAPLAFQLPMGLIAAMETATYQRRVYDKFGTKEKREAKR